jgi:hypothetical protein
VLAMTLPEATLKIPDHSYGVYVWHAPIYIALWLSGWMQRGYIWVTASSIATILISLSPLATLSRSPHSNARIGRSASGGACRDTSRSDVRARRSCSGKAEHGARSREHEPAARHPSDRAKRFPLAERPRAAIGKPAHGGLRETSRLAIGRM